MEHQGHQFHKKSSESIDISYVINSARSHNVNWAFSFFSQIMEELKNEGYTVTYWESEENWASILNSTSTIGYMWSKYPLIFIEKNEAQKLKSIKSQFIPVEILEVESLSQEFFRIEDKELKRYFLGAFNLNCFTIEDLWFGTNLGDSPF